MPKQKTKTGARGLLMSSIIRAEKLAIGVLLPMGCCYAQGAGQSQTPMPDVLICNDGEKFVGRLVSSNASSVVFKSDAVGQVSVDWSKVQELNSSTEFAALPKGVKLRGPKDQNTVPQGTVAAAGQQMQIRAGPQAAPQTMPVTNVAQLVNEAAFRRAFRRRNFFEGWSDKVTVGVAYTNSTQKSQSYTAAVNLTREMPSETWLDQKRRTLVNFFEEYGEISSRQRRPRRPPFFISMWNRTGICARGCSDLCRQFGITTFRRVCTCSRTTAADLGPLCLRTPSNSST
jgi:hypothetical protein